MAIDLDEREEYIPAEHRLVVLFLLNGLGYVIDERFFAALCTVVEFALQRCAILSTLDKTAVDKRAVLYLVEIEMALAEYDIGKRALAEGIAKTIGKCTSLNRVIECVG